MTGYEWSVMKRYPRHRMDWGKYEASVKYKKDKDFFMEWLEGTCFREVGERKGVGSNSVRVRAERFVSFLRNKIVDQYSKFCFANATEEFWRNCIDSMPCELLDWKTEKDGDFVYPIALGISGAGNHMSHKMCNEFEKIVIMN